MEKLLTCPFCGNDQIYTRYNGSRSGRFYYLECDLCGARTRGVCVPFNKLQDMDEWDNEAVERVTRLWNRRV